VDAASGHDTSALPEAVITYLRNELSIATSTAAFLLTAISEMAKSYDADNDLPPETDRVLRGHHGGVRLQRRLTAFALGQLYTAGVKRGAGL